MAQATQRYYRSSYALTLRAFYHVARLHSFARAAERLGIDESTISLQVRALERDLGARLFERRGRGGTPLTEEGRYLLAIAAPIVTGLETLKERFDGRLRLAPQGPVTIATGEVAGRCFLPAIIQAAHEQCPEVEIVAVRKTGADVFAALSRQQADFALTSVHIIPPDVAFVECVRSELCLITSRDHPLRGLPEITLEDVVAYPFVVADHQFVNYEMLRETMHVCGLQMRVAQTVGSLAAVTRCVELDMGIGVVPRVCTNEPGFSRELGVISAGHLFGTRCYGILYARGRQHSVAARALIRLITDLRHPLRLLAGLLPLSQEPQRFQVAGVLGAAPVGEPVPEAQHVQAVQLGVLEGRQPRGHDGG